MLLIRGISVLIGCLLFGCLYSPWVAVEASEQQESLRLSVWGGSHGAMLDHALLAPFASLANANLQTRPRRSAESELKSDSVDVIELELQEAIEACDNGALSLLPSSELGDFVPTALQPCAIGQYVWSTVYAYNQTDYSYSNRPSLISDFFNVSHYPGRRAVKRSPRVLSEWSLLAAGVSAVDVYETLSQPELAWQIIERSLEPIASSIVWVDDDDQAVEMLQNGTVSFAMVGSDALIRAVVAGADNVFPVWDGSVSQISLWGIPVESSNPELAWQFVRYATSVDASQRFSAVSGYGPARFSSLEQMNSAYHPYLPSNRANLANTVWGSSGWWRDHGKPLNEQFVKWLSNQFLKSDT